MNSRLFVGLLVGLAVAVCAPTGAEPVTQPSGKLTWHSSCKKEGDTARRGGAALGSSEACIQYSYTRRGGLSLRHINAGFNCCPGELTVEVVIDELTISVIEREEKNGCRCVCLYDIDIDVTDLKPAVYVVEFGEPYLGNGNERFEFTVDLVADREGEICLSRSGGPWR